MTEDQAEQIEAVASVGMFHGTITEYIQAMAVLSARDKRIERENEVDNPQPAT